MPLIISLLLASNTSDPTQTDDGKTLPEMVLAGLQRLKLSLQLDRQELAELEAQVSAQEEMVDDMITQLRQ